MNSQDQVEAGRCLHDQIWAAQIQYTAKLISARRWSPTLQETCHAKGGIRHDRNVGTVGETRERITCRHVANGSIAAAADRHLHERLCPGWDIPMDARSVPSHRTAGADAEQRGHQPVTGRVMHARRWCRVTGRNVLVESNEMAPSDQNSVERLNLQRQLGQRRHIKGPIVSVFRKVGKAMQVNRPETLGQLDFRNQWEKQVAVVFDIESTANPDLQCSIGTYSKISWLRRGPR